MMSHHQHHYQQQQQQQQQHPAVWSGCTRFRLPSTIAKVLDRLQRRRNGGLKTYRIFIQNLENRLIGLPVELILLITSFLSPVDQQLLSLSSKRLRVVLMDYLDLSLTDHGQKVEFLQALEKDMPDYLVCLTCAWMFKWRLRESSSYTCPYRLWSSSKNVHKLLGRRICQHHRVEISEEILALILRANRHGSNFGLPPSYCDHDCDTPSRHQTDPIRRSSEGRIVKNQFFLARSYTFACDFTHPEEFASYFVYFSTCMHSTWDVRFYTETSVKKWDRQQPQHLATRKCKACATDVKVSLSSLPASPLVRVEINVWQNYGKSLPPSPGDVSTGFGINHGLLGKDVVARRDLEHEFNASRRFANLDEDRRV